MAEKDIFVKTFGPRVNLKEFYCKTCKKPLTREEYFHHENKHIIVKNEWIIGDDKSTLMRLRGCHNCGHLTKLMRGAECKNCVNDFTAPNWRPIE